MARPRTPAAVAKVTGAEQRSPGRFAGRAKPKVAPLGAPPKWLTEAEAAVWLEFAADMPWLARSDRHIVGAAARLQARMISDPDMGVNALAQLRMCLSAMGGTPCDRSKVSPMGEDEDDDEAAEFFN